MSAIIKFKPDKPEISRRKGKFICYLQVNNEKMKDIRKGITNYIICDRCYWIYDLIKPHDIIAAMTQTCEKSQALEVISVGLSIDFHLNQSSLIVFKPVSDIDINNI